MKTKLAASLAIGLLAGALFPILRFDDGRERIDFHWSVFAARDLAAGRDPYAPTSHFFMIPYPLTAALVAFPLAGLPGTLAASIFMGASSALLAFGLLREGPWWRLLAFVSTPYVVALTCAQWSPLMMALMFFPALLPLSLAKPQFTLPVLFPRLTRRRAAACAGFVLLSLAIDPTWPSRWLGKVGPYGGFLPIAAYPPLALAALRWRDPRARHLTLMACMPQHRFLYDGLLLWTLPRSLGEMLFLTWASWLAFLAAKTFCDFLSWGEVLTLVGIYIPSLILVFRGAAIRDVKGLIRDALPSRGSAAGSGPSVGGPEGTIDAVRVATPAEARGPGLLRPRLLLGEGAEVPDGRGGRPAVAGGD